MSTGVLGQMVSPVQFSTELRKTGDADIELVFSGIIEAGWHVYSTQLGQSGPIEASIHFTRKEGVELKGSLTAEGNEMSQYDPLFDMNLRYFENKVTFVQKLRMTSGHYALEGFLEYGACSESVCMPPTKVAFNEEGKGIEKAQQAEQSEKNEATASPVPEAETSVVDSVAATDSIAASQEIHLTEESSPEEETSLWLIFLEGLLGGLIALFTPCVWPIIPMTVSFFLKKSANRRKAIADAAVYGLSIVIIYVSLGLIVTLLFGANALNALSTNAFVNIFFALLLVVFAASFLGAFELTLPASWANRIDGKVEKSKAGTLLPIFLMAFTLALVSFSCTGPIIGFLLVAVSTQGRVLSPAVGMTGFAVALAIPFTLFALFPSMLKSAPKSGAWMNTIKVVLAFIELAFALKFVSVADMAYGWHILDRDVFVSIWIVLFMLLGCYLIGWIHFPLDDEKRRTSVTRFFMAAASFSFAFYMIPGLWGAPLRAISAFTPPMSTQEFNLLSTKVEPKTTDFEQAVQLAKSQRKPLMVDFTGYGCVNCRKMEASVWTDKRIADVINNDFVLVSLYVDDKTDLPTPVEVTEENGQKTMLYTIGDKWSYLQRRLAKANTQPCYLLLDNENKPLVATRSYNEDKEAYLEFLMDGLKKYGERDGRIE